MEQSLYNAVAAGVSLTGDLFCYATPLASRGDFKRSPWFGVPCCPTTIARFLPSLGQYIYSRSSDGLWVNLFIASEATTAARLRHRSRCSRSRTTRGKAT